MNGTQEKVYIKLTKLGNREQDVVAVLSRIQGLKDTPEQLIADIPCYISDKVPLTLAEKVKTYLEKAGADVVIEDEHFHPVVDDDFLSLNDVDTPIFDQTDETSIFEEQHDTSSYETGIDQIETIPVVPTSSLHMREALSDRQQSEQFETVFEEEPELSRPRKRSFKQRRLFRKTPITAVGGGIVALLLIIGLWLLFSGRLTNLAPTSGNTGGRQTGGLNIENPEAADVRLYHVIGTRVIKELMFEGDRVTLQNGDYYLEAQKGSQIVRFPVYIEGRGHQVMVKVVFPEKKPASDKLAYIPSGWFRMGNKETVELAHFGFPDEKPDIDVFVSGFFLSKYEVTNREFARFVQDGGYRNELYWERLIQDWPSLVQQVPSYGKVYGNNGWDSVERYILTRFIDTDDRPGPRLWEADTPPYTYGQDEYPVSGFHCMKRKLIVCGWPGKPERCIACRLKRNGKKPHVAMKVIFFPTGMNTIRNGPTQNPKAQNRSGCIRQIVMVYTI